MFKKNVFACLLLLLSMQVMAQESSQNGTSGSLTADKPESSETSRRVSVNPSWYLPGAQYLPSVGRVHLKDPQIIVLDYGLSTPGYNWWGVVFTDVTDNSKVYSCEAYSPGRNGFGGGELVRIPAGRYNVRFEYWWDQPSIWFYFGVGCQDDFVRHPVGYEMFDVLISPETDCAVTISD